MGRGGARVGSGPKVRKGAVEFVVFDGGRPLEVPADVPAAQAVYWRRYVTLAMNRGTLTEHTEPTFRLLCRTEAELAATDDIIQRDGRTFLKVTIDGAGQEHQELKAHPLLSHYRALLKQQQNLFEKFCLGPFGKPVAGAKRTKADDAKAVTRSKFFGVQGHG